MKLKGLSRQSKSSSTGSSIGRSQVQCSQASYCNDLLIKVLVAGSNNENAIFRLPQHNVICKMPTDNVTFANNLETERCSHEAVYFSLFTAETKNIWSEIKTIHEKFVEPHQLKEKEMERNANQQIHTLQQKNKELQNLI